MKERIVIEGKEPKEVIRKLVKASSLIMYEKLEKEDRICIYGEELKRIKVPETWEELKTMCEDLESKDVFITSAGDCIEYHGLCFWKDGSISHNADQSMYAIKIDLTPARQWQIIKNLIGEE